MASDPGAGGLPEFPIEIAPPVLEPAWREGNCGVPGFVSHAADAAGPHVVLMALIHGNELAGAVVLAELLAAGIRPLRGRLTIGFANLAAFDRFDPAQPTASRFIDEDLNRLWDAAVLDGPRAGAELSRARAMRPIVDSADRLLDLHSMLWPSEPLLLCGPTEKGRELARGIGTPGLIVADEGHVSGRRLIDYGPFAQPSGDRAAVLVEAGQHWLADTVAQSRSSVLAMLRHCGLLPGSALPPRPPRFARVTEVVTAGTAGFGFVQPWRGGEVVPRRGTLIATDGDTEVRTPHDDCLLVMPSLRTGRGHTAVRLARFVPP
jgi:predicted deacylase